MRLHINEKNRIDLYKISNNKLFLTSSIFFCFVINLIHPTWFMDSFGNVDSWFYYGTGEYFKYIKFHFSDTYYFRRWPINLNNLLFSSLFGPFYGKYILKNIILFFCIFFLKKIIYLISNKSLICTFGAIFFIFFFHKKILLNVGTSYVQSESILLFTIYIFLLLTHKENLRKLFLTTTIISLLLIIHQANIKWILASFILIFFDEDFKLEFNFNSIKKLINILLFAFILILFFDNIIEIILGVNWNNFFMYSYETVKNVRDPFIKSYDTFYQDLFKRIFTVTYISGVITSSYLVLNLKNFNNKYFKRIIIFYIFLSVLILLEPFHKLGFSIYIQNSWAHLLLSIIISSVLLFDLIKNFKKKIFNSNKIHFNTNILKFISHFLLLILIIFINFKVGNTFSTEGIRDEINYSDYKKKIYKINAENKTLTKLALMEEKRITLIDDRPHSIWSANISQLYGMYSALSVGYPVKFHSCNLVDWQLSYSPDLIIAIFSNKNVSDDLNLLKKVTNNCEFKGDFEYIETINQDIKLFKVKDLIND